MKSISKRCSKQRCSDLTLIVYYTYSLYFHLSIKDACWKQLCLHRERRGGPEEWEISTFLRDYIREGMVTPFSPQYPVPFNYSPLSWLKAFGMEIMALRDADSFIGALHSWAFYVPLCIQGQFHISILARRKVTYFFYFFFIFRISVARLGWGQKQQGELMLKLNNERQLMTNNTKSWIDRIA